MTVLELSECSTRRQLLAALAAASVAGCSDTADSLAAPTPSDPATPTPVPTPTPTPEPEGELYVYWQSGERWGAKLEDEIVPQFTADYDVTVELAYKNGHRRDWFGNLEWLLDEGMPPLYFDSLPPMGEYLARELLQPVDHVVEDLVAANGDLVVQSPIQVQGTAYLVPHDVICGGVFHYRTDVYDELGLSVPETWDALLENARTIDEAGQFETRGFAVGAPDWPKAERDFTSWFYNAGGQYFRWADDGQTEIEVDFQTEQVRATLEFMLELAQYSPDPGDQTESEVRANWRENVVAQCLSPGTLLVQAAHHSGQEKVALNTRQALVPFREPGIDPIDRGWATVRGSVSFAGANQDAAAEFLRFMYEGPERQAEMNVLAGPMNPLPPYRRVLETETYQSQDLFQAYDGHFLDLQRHVMDEIAPHLAGDRPRTPAAFYALQSGAIVDMVHAIVADGKPIEDEIDRARNRLQRRLEDGRALGSK